MIGLFGETLFQGRPLDHYRSFVYGPVCVDRPNRGTGILEGLFRAQLKIVQATFEVGVLFVSRNNPRSLQAHVRHLGMTRLRDFDFEGGAFSLLAFEVSEKK